MNENYLCTLLLFGIVSYKLIHDKEFICYDIIV